MKEFLVLFHDTWVPDPTIQAAWQTWFAHVGDRFADSGNPFTGGIEVSRDGARDLAPGDGPATGYSILSADSLADVERLLADCPYESRVRVYEAQSM